LENLISNPCNCT